MARFTKGQRNTIRNAVEDDKASEWSHRIGDMLDDLDAADEEIRIRKLQTSELIADGIEMRRKVERLRAALQRIVSIEPTASEHALLTTSRMAMIAREALDGDHD